MIPKLLPIQTYSGISAYNDKLKYCRSNQVKKQAAHVNVKVHRNHKNTADEQNKKQSPQHLGLHLDCYI